MLFVEKVELNIELRFGFFPQKLPGPLDMIITLLLISIFSFPAKKVPLLKTSHRGHVLHHSRRRGGRAEEGKPIYGGGEGGGIELNHCLRVKGFL
jgi:hypothetical protein